MLGFFWPLVFLGGAQRRLLTRGAPVLMYHKLGPPPRGTRDPFLYTTREALDRHLRLLDASGLRLVSLTSFLAKPVDAKSAVITFDDGFRNVLDNGLEVLARHRACAIQFLATDWLGRCNQWDVANHDVAEPLMNRDEIKRWLAAGHEIGSHSASHRNLKKLSPERQREEIHGSKKLLEDVFGVPVRHFCYPFGGFTPAVRDMVIEAGYESACSTQFGVNDAQTDRYALRRIIPLSSAELARKVVHRLLLRCSRR